MWESKKKYYNLLKYLHSLPIIPEPILFPQLLTARIGEQFILWASGNFRRGFQQFLFSPAALADRKRQKHCRKFPAKSHPNLLEIFILILTERQMSIFKMSEWFDLPILKDTLSWVHNWLAPLTGVRRWWKRQEVQIFIGLKRTILYATNLKLPLWRWDCGASPCFSLCKYTVEKVVTLQ